MSGDRPDSFNLIGLHKMAQSNGDGLVPELLAALAERHSRFEDEMLLRHTAAGKEDDDSGAGARPANVLHFPRPFRRTA
jgi:hypothetical protein